MLSPMKAVALLAVLLCCISAIHAATRQTWIQDVTIISPDDLDHIGVGSVLIDGTRIVRVERNPRAHAPRGATIVSGKGEFLVPGLIDSHVHLALVPGVPLEQIFDPNRRRPEMIRDYFEQLPRSYLYFGFTTLVDLAVMEPRVLDQFRNAPAHPDLYDCGASLPLVNGYPMSFASPELRFRLYPKWIFDPQHPTEPPTGADLTKHTPAAAVAAVRREHGICVKIYFDRLGNDANVPVVTQALIAQVRKSADRYGLPLIMHANSFEAQKFGVDADVDVIAHGMWNWGDLNSQPDLPPQIKALLDQIVDRHIGYQPTMQVMQGFRAYFDPEYLHMEAVAKVVPPALLAWFQTSEGQWFKQQIGGAQQQPDANVRNAYDRGPIRRGDQVIAYLAAKNARFLFGTDTPSAPSYGNLPGLNEYLEMKDLQRAGLSPRQILRAATIENARRFHLDSQVGTIEQGKTANLLLLRKSPLETIEAYDSIDTVWIEGRAIPRDALAADRLR
jgi:imidazolonepropionase-like amidohydrolase